MITLHSINFSQKKKTAGKIITLKGNKLKDVDKFKLLISWIYSSRKNVDQNLTNQGIKGKGFGR